MTISICVFIIVLVEALITLIRAIMRIVQIPQCIIGVHYASVKAAVNYATTTVELL